MSYYRCLFPFLLLAQAAFAQSNHDTAWSAQQAIDSLNTEGLVLTFVRHLNAGKDSVQVKRLPEELYFDFFAAKTVHIDGQVFLHTLQISRKSRDYWQAHPPRYFQVDYTERRSDTLVLFQNAFIERERPVKHSIEMIRYLLWGGFTSTGSCRLRILGDSVKLEREADVTPKNRIDSGGVFICRLDAVTRNRLYALLQNMDFPRLKNKYQMRGSCASTGVLEITYDRGKKKTITDYGAIGTYGLSALQSLLLSLQETQQWARTNAETPFMLGNLDR